MRSFLRHLFGYDYLLNKQTGEVHYLPKTKYQCGIGRMVKENQQYLTKKQFEKIRFTYIDRKYINGCRFCNWYNDKE